ncbi:MAG: hypothetical protein JRI97_10720 [Deltaproteobacteria bacterium]|nr:hypothetical protein [Deltaproteobacteria bacterium]
MNWVQILARPGEVGEVVSGFFEVWVTAGGPEDMAVFAHRRRGARVLLFVSPAMAAQAPDLVERYGGTECEPPPRNFVELQCGQGDALDRLLDNQGDICPRED